MFYYHLYFRIVSFREKLQKSLFYGPVITFIIELTLEGTVSSIVNIIWAFQNWNSITPWWTFGDYLSLALSFLFLVLPLSMIIFVPILLLKKESDFVKHYFSELSESDDRLYHSIFIIRRFIFVGIVFLASDYPYFQL